MKYSKNLTIIIKLIFILLCFKFLLLQTSFSNPHQFGMHEDANDPNNPDNYQNSDFYHNVPPNQWNFEFVDWSKVPDSVIGDISPEDLDYSQLSSSQRHSMVASQIRHNWFEIEDLFNHVNINQVRFALTQEMPGVSLDINGPFSVRPPRPGVMTSLIEGGEVASFDRIVEQYRSIEVTPQGEIIFEPKQLQETFGTISIPLLDEDQPTITADGGNYRVNIDPETGGTRTIVDNEGREFQISSGLITVQDGGIYLSSETGSVIVNGVQLDLQSQSPLGTAELARLISSSSNHGVIDIDRSSLSPSSQAVLQGVFNPSSSEEEMRIASAPLSEVVSIIPDQLEEGTVIEDGRFQLIDSTTQVRVGSVSGTAQEGYITTPINDRVGLNIISGEEEIRTIDLQTTNPDAQVFTLRDEDSTTRVRTNVDDVIVDEGTQYEYRISLTGLGVNNRNNQGGIFFQSSMRQGTIGIESRGSVSTSWGNGLGVSIGNSGSNDGVLTSTQSCLGNYNCIARRSISENQEIISVTAGNTGDWRIFTVGNDDIERNYFVEVQDGGRASIDETYTDLQGNEIRRRVTTSQRGMEVEGFSDISTNIFGISIGLSSDNIMHYITSGQQEVGELDRTSGTEFVEEYIAILENSPFKDQISELILSLEDYDADIFSGDSIFDAFMELGMPELAQSLDARRELYRVLFNGEEPPTSSAVMNQRLLEKLRLGREEAFSNVEIERRIESEEIGVIREQLFGSEITTALQELRMGSSGNQIDPASLVPEVFSESFEAIFSQDTSEIFSQLSSSQQESIVVTLRELGIENPSFEMRRELYRVLEGEYPQVGDRGVTMNMRLLEAIENNEFQQVVQVYNQQLQQRADTHFSGDLAQAIDDLVQREREIQQELGNIVHRVLQEEFIDSEPNTRAGVVERVVRGIVVTPLHSFFSDPQINQLDGSYSIGGYLGVGPFEQTGVHESDGSSYNSYLESLTMRLTEIYTSIFSQTRGVMSRDEAIELTREVAILESDITTSTLFSGVLQIPEDELREQTQLYLQQVEAEQFAPLTSLVPRERPSRSQPLSQSQDSSFPPTPANVQELATSGTINLDNYNLIGVFGTPSSRTIMIRSPEGGILRGGIGDTFEGVGRIRSIEDSSVIFTDSQGSNITLTIGG